MKIEIDDLRQYLIDHKDEIDYVVLQWSWSPNYAVVATNNIGTVNGKDVPLYAMFSYVDLDREYSFSGTVEKAIEYTSAYDQWLSGTFELYDGILMGEFDGYHPDAEQFPDEDLDLNDDDVVDVAYEGLYYYLSGKQHLYHGEVRRDEE